MLLLLHLVCARTIADCYILARILMPIDGHSLCSRTRSEVLDKIWLVS